jgi:hypothetical protein
MTFPVVHRFEASLLPVNLPSEGLLFLMQLSIGPLRATFERAATVG